MTIKKSVIIPVYNRVDFISKCLDSILEIKDGETEIIVVDDCSTDGTRNKLDDYNASIKILYNETNKGPSFSRNPAIKESQGEFILLTDSDCIVDGDWIKEICRPFSIDENIVITTGKVMDAKPSNYWESVNKGNVFVALKDGYVRTAIGGNMAIRRSFMINNLFNENIRTAEERELCLKALQHGNKIYYTEKAKVLHHHRSTFRSSLKQQFWFGYGNARIYIRYKKFPFISYGSWILIGSIIFYLLANFLHLQIFFSVSFYFLIMFLGLVLLVDIIPKRKSISELIITYPGMLINCLAIWKSYRI